MKIFKLYGTSACHLCELAQAMVASQQALLENIEVMEEDIAGSDTLFERYGMRIPVLRHPDQRELNWPFSIEQLEEFLRS
jgi:hypothetical protein